MKSSLKWKRAKPIYPTDHIVSSKAKELGIIGFKPEYEEEKHVNIRFILSNEYMRLWFKERQLYQKENYSKHENARTDHQIRRGYVQRMMTSPKLENRELPIIQLKRFQNIMSKVDNRRTAEEKEKVCSRFRKTVEPVELTRYKPACPNLKQKSPTSKRATTSDRAPPPTTPEPGKVDDSKVVEPPTPTRTTPKNSPGCAMHCKLVTE